jgi:hypothetical protein
MKTRLTFSTVLILMTAAAIAQQTSTQVEKSSRTFETLFDGSSLDGWKHSGNWKIEDGVITREGKGGSLVYSAKKIPDDFELRFEWKVAKGSNSGVYYRPGQYEYQILDNTAHADGQNPRTSAASLYFCMPPSEDATNPVGEWNKARIVCKGTIIQHWLNDKKVLDFDYTEEKWAFNVNMLAKRGGQVTTRGASLSLQDHGDPVWYRDIRLRAIGADEDIRHTDISPAEISAEVLKKEKEKLDGIVKRRDAAKNKKKQ